MVAEKKRSTLDVDAELQRRLKAAAVGMGVSVREYCETALYRALDGADEQGVVRRGWLLSSEEVRRLQALQEETFRDRRPYDSVTLVREGREVRTVQLDPPR